MWPPEAPVDETQPFANGAGRSRAAAGEWLRLAKVGQAAEALASTRLPIKSTSEDAGFGSEASFYRAFRSTTGPTPSAYRQAYGSTPLDKASAATD